MRVSANPPVLARENRAVHQPHGKPKLSAVGNAVEELEATARLALLLKRTEAQALNADQVGAIIRKFDLEWDQ